MTHFLDLSIKWKLVLGFCIGLVSLLLVAGFGIHAMTTLRNIQTEIQEIQLNNVIDYLSLDASLSRNRLLLLRMMRSNSQAEREGLQLEIAATSAENSAIMARLAERVVRDPLPADRFAALDAARNEFNRVRDTLIIPAILAGHRAEAEAAFEIGTEHYREVSVLAGEFVQLAKDDARHAGEQAIALVRSAVFGFGAIALAALALSVLAILALHRVIALPVNRAAETAARIGAGELDLWTPGEERRDEIGALARAFNQMSASLRDLAAVADKIADGDLSSRVRPRSKLDRLAISFDIMSANLAGLTSEMKSGAGEVNAATVEILELTREFLVQMTDRERARRFQDALLRLEEVSKRLGAVVGQIKLPGGQSS